MFDRSNVKNGAQAEKFVAEELAKLGYWVGTFDKGVSGSQPFDCIAIGEQYTIAFDVKLCKTDRFSFDRVEENQDLALGYITYELRNPNVITCFMIVYENEIYILSFEYYKEILLGGHKKSIKVSELARFKDVF